MKKPSESRSVEYVPLASLREAEANPKRHAGKQIAASVGRFGFVEPMVIDERTKRLVAGHGRREALLALKKAGGPPPAGVREANGEWLVPVLRGWRSRNKSEAEAYLIASNRLVESGGWDNAELDRMLADLGRAGEDALVGLDVTPGHLEALLRGLDTEGAGDAMPDVPSSSWVKFGDLFALGPHRLLCGDSTNRLQVEVLMGSERAGLMNTDPPYGVAYDTADRAGGPSKPAIANDQLQDAALQAFLEAAFGAAKDCALKLDAGWYLWHAHLTQGFFAAAAAAAAAANVVLHRQIIWVKPSMLLTRGQYHWQHEPCFFGWVKGHQPPDFGRGEGERNQTTVWEIGGVAPGERAELGHPTPKPVALFEIPIVKHLLPGEICYEPFAGSGPQFIGAERTGRRCFGMELEPRYCQVIIERWEKFTGSKHAKLS